MGPLTPTTLDALPIGMAALDSDLRVKMVNAAFAKFIPIEVPLHQDILDLVSQAALAVERLADGPVYQLRSGETDHWMRLDLHRHDGAVMAVLVDVSDERHEVENLRFAYAMRDQLMDDAGINCWRYDPELEVFLHRENTQSVAPPLVIPEETVRRDVHPDDLDHDAETRKRLVVEGGVSDHQVRYRNRQGPGWSHRRNHVRAGRRMPSGRYELFGLSQDVTALSEARDQSDAAAKLLKLAMKTANAGVFEIDFVTGEFKPSPEFLAMVAEDARAVVPENPLPYFLEDDWRTLRSLYNRVRETRSTGTADVRLLAPGGHRWVRLFLEAQTMRDGVAVRGVGLMLDIDGQKRQELALTEARVVAESATEAKSNFLASMSHEIRTPMNGIVGVLNLMRKERLSRDGGRLLEEALACSEMLSQLINDVLDFSKIEAGKLDLSPAACDPLGIAQSVVSLVAPQARAKTVSIRIAAPPEMDGAWLDPVRLRQILFNVLGNAVKFTEAGWIEVRMDYLGEGDTRRLRCEVQDTGVGVPAHAQSYLFDRFRQAEAGATRRFGGTGLGLAISRNLARMMGGDMGFESEEACGSTFWFEVDARPAQAPTSIGSSAFDGAPLDGLRILVVDDNATNRIVAVKTLEALGALAVAVDSGPAAIEEAPVGGYDIILMDVNMPGMGGVEAARHIRALNSPVAQAPIIAHTADVMHHQQATYRQAGMDGLVSKPFTPMQLIAEIARIAAAAEALEADDQPVDRASEG
jgi:signal transduction histidine kinase/AmiR/NasT family two-component response regulator